MQTPLCNHFSSTRTLNATLQLHTQPGLLHPNQRPPGCYYFARHLAQSVFFGGGRTCGLCERRPPRPNPPKKTERPTVSSPANPPRFASVHTSERPTHPASLARIVCAQTLWFVQCGLAIPCVRNQPSSPTEREYCPALDPSPNATRPQNPCTDPHRNLTYKRLLYFALVQDPSPTTQAVQPATSLSPTPPLDIYDRSCYTRRRWVSRRPGWSDSPRTPSRGIFAYKTPSKSPLDTISPTWYVLRHTNVL